MRHCGYSTGDSSLIVVVPARERVFSALADSDELSESLRLGSGDLLNSPLAQAFVHGFVTGTLGESWPAARLGPVGREAARDGRGPP